MQKQNKRVPRSLLENLKKQAIQETPIKCFQEFLFSLRMYFMEARENGDMYNLSRQIKQTYLIFPEQDSDWGSPKIKCQYFTLKNKISGNFVNST